MKRLHGESRESATDVDGDIILTPREDCITFSFFFFFFFYYVPFFFLFLSGFETTFLFSLSQVSLLFVALCC